MLGNDLCLQAEEPTDFKRRTQEEEKEAVKAIKRWWAPVKDVNIVCQVAIFRLKSGQWQLFSHLHRLLIFNTD